jgi:hypothetical protein
MQVRLMVPNMGHHFLNKDIKNMDLTKPHIPKPQCMWTALFRILSLSLMPSPVIVTKTSPKYHQCALVGPPPA